MNLHQIYNRKLNGESRFVSDISPDNALAILTVRAAIAKGKILSISNPELPEGFRIFSHKEIPGKNTITIFGISMPLLAEENITYKGEPILLLAGPDHSVLETLADKIKIEYEEEEAEEELEAVKASSLHNHIKYLKGNIQEAFDKAEQIIRGTYKTGTQAPLNIEPHTVVSIYDKGRLIVYSSGNYPFNIKDNIASVLNIPKKKVRVIVPDTSTPVGGNIIVPAIIACHCAIASYAMEKSAKLQLTYFESVRFSSKRYPFLIDFSSAIDKKGNLLGHRININIDNGRYNFSSKNIVNKAIISAIGNYKCDNFEVDITFNFTNKLPLGGFDGIGESEICFAQEVHSNKIARLINSDPFTWKESNISRINLFTGKKTNKTDQDTPFRVIEKVIHNSDFIRKYGSYSAIVKKGQNPFKSTFPIRGIGLALCPHNILVGQEDSRSFYYVKAVLQKERKLRIFTSSVDLSNSKITLFAATAARILNLNITDVEVEQVDTEKVPDSGATIGSRSIMILNNLIEQCCLTIKRRQVKGPYPIEVKKRFSTAQTMFARSTERHRSLIATAWEGTVVEVEINPITLEIFCRGIWIVIDVGKIINPEVARSHVEFSAAHNFEFATCGIGNEHKYSSYRNQNIEYTALGVMDIPPVHIEFVNHKNDNLQPKGLGDQPVCGIAPAYVAAVSQAISIDFNQLPLTPELVQAYFPEET